MCVCGGGGGGGGWGWGRLTVKCSDLRFPLVAVYVSFTTVYSFTTGTASHCSCDCESRLAPLIVGLYTDWQHKTLYGSFSSVSVSAQAS